MTTHPDPLLALSAELPELPEPVAFLHNIPRNALFSADQMRAYTTEAVLRAANARGDEGHVVVGTLKSDAEGFHTAELSPGHPLPANTVAKLFIARPRS